MWIIQHQQFVYLTKAKLKTGEEDELDLNSSGIIVTAIARKNRLAKPKKVKFEIIIKLVQINIKD